MFSRTKQGSFVRTVSHSEFSYLSRLSVNCYSFVRIIATLARINLQRTWKSSRSAPASDLPEQFDREERKDRSICLNRRYGTLAPLTFHASLRKPRCGLCRCCYCVIAGNGPLPSGAATGRGGGPALEAALKGSLESAATWARSPSIETRREPTRSPSIVNMQIKWQ